MTINPGDQVETARELMQAPEEFRTAVEKIVISHAVNELYGAQVFDEPAIAFFIRHCQLTNIVKHSRSCPN